MRKALFALIILAILLSGCPISVNPEMQEIGNMDVKITCSECDSESMCARPVLIQCFKQGKPNAKDIKRWLMFSGEVVCEGNCEEGSEEQDLIIRALTNPDLCEELPNQTGDHSKDTCYKEYVIYTGDASVCDRISDSEKVEKCKTEYVTAYENLKKYINYSED